MTNFPLSLLAMQSKLRNRHLVNTWPFKSSGGIYILALLLFGLEVSAMVHTVTNRNDSGAGSLRDAIDGSAASDTVMFSSVMIGGDATIHLASSLVIAHDLVIIGINDETGIIYISGENTHRVFVVSAVNLVLEDVAIVYGRATKGGAIQAPGFGTSIICRNCFFEYNVATQQGGAIYFTNGTLELNETTMAYNSASAEGGAIYYEIGMEFRLNNSNLNNNTSGQQGGAIYTKGGGLNSTFEVIKSTINQNTSGAEGAAIFIEGRNFYMDSCTVNFNTCNGGLYKGVIHAELRSSIPNIIGSISNTTVGQNTGIGVVSFITLNNSTPVTSDFDISNSTIYNNTLGGIYSSASTSGANSTSNVTVSTSTVSGNGGPVGASGGIYSVAFGLDNSYSYISNVNVTSSTVVDNESDGNGASGIFSRGKIAATSYLGVKSSIVAGNSGVNLMSYAPTSPITSLGYNVFGEASVLGSGNDELGVSPASLNLKPIGFYGGSTPTRMPNQGSVVINIGTPNEFSDAQNGPIQGGRRDAGAAEYIPCIIQNAIVETLCAGDSVLFGGLYRKTAGTFVATIPVGACDSVVTLNLNFLPINLSTQNVSLCFGNSFSVGNSVYTSTGQYTDTFNAANDCDSIVVTNLTINLANSVAQAFSICPGETVTVGSNIYSTSGTYTDIFTDLNDCDSTVTTTITLLPVSQSSISQSICFGESFEGYSASGTYIDIFEASNGCDSTRTLTLTLNDLPEPTITQNGPVLTTQDFANYQWLLDGSSVQDATAQSHTAIANGDYTVLVTDANGCMAESDMFQMLQVSISDNATALDALNVFPNPSTGQFTIALQTDRITRLTIMDIQGKQVHDVTLNTSLVQVNITLPEGIYMLQVMTKVGMTYNKLMMIH